MNKYIYIFLLLVQSLAGSAWAATHVETIDSGFNGSGGVTVGPDGNIYVSDYGPNLSRANGTSIWKITPDGQRSLFVTGLAGASGSAFDSQGNLFQSHLNGGTVRRITPDGQMTTYSTGFSGPVGLVINANDEIFVANCRENTIRKAVPNGRSTLFTGSVLFNCPNGLTLDDNGNLYTVNFLDSNMLKITATGQVSLFTTIPGGGNGHVVYRDGVLYATSFRGNRLFRVSMDGDVTVLAGSAQPGRDDGPSDQARFFRPNGIDINADGTIIYVNDSDVITSTDQLHSNSLRAVHLDTIEMNAGLNDAWFNPATEGQGFFITVFAELGVVSLAWFTYDTVLPDQDAHANLGDPGHRWLTALGTIDGNRAVMDISNTSGGLFDTATQIERVNDGTITLTFDDCNAGTVDYDIPSIAQQGSVPIERVASDNIALCEALIGASASQVSINYIGNLGVMIQFEDKEVVIDGLLGPVQGWVSPSTADQAAIAAGSVPYQDVEIAAFTHNHGDHIGFTSMSNFLSNQPNTMLLGPDSAGLSNIPQQSQVQEITLNRFQSQQFTINGIPITVFHTRHFDQFGNDFSQVTNLAYLVELGGRKILHIGDFDYAADNIQALGLQAGELDAIIMPTFNTLISAANFDLITSMLAPSVIIVAHFQSGLLATQTNQVLNLLPEAVIFDTAGESIELE